MCHSVQGSVGTCRGQISITLFDNGPGSSYARGVLARVPQRKCSEFELLLSSVIVMPARSRTKSASKDVQARSKEKLTKSDDTVSDIEKENRSRAARTRSKAQVTPSTDTRHAKNDTYCLCNQPDDGSPMVCCSECSEWCVL
ncbi:hypothetical protein L210DRAFT_2636771 [Boletus edulis BED1]|uniref:Uncharacterized protein n=1 Tax=Boletus edulis BED1 TaxID=1328754 RepID=A0AAD4GJJ1_BOLED|nr:hypothetical protein L210DRAFT_2636771 [Boletus edulis BED1]